MKDKNSPNPHDTDDDKIHVTQSVFMTAKEIQEKQKAQEEEMRQKIAEREKKRREAYDRRILEEKKELLRLKQGTIQESETIHEEERVEIKLSFFGKIQNFFYHNKWWLWIACVMVFFAGYLAYDIITRERPDIVVLLITENDDLGYTDNLKNYVTQFTEDTNKNKEILASVYYIPYTQNINQNYANGVDGKLTVEMESEEAVILIGDKLITEITDPDVYLVNLEELFPDNPHVEGYKFNLKGSKFAEKLGVSEDAVHDDLFLAIRKPLYLRYADMDDMQETYDRDFPVFEKIIADLSE